MTRFKPQTSVTRFKPGDCVSNYKLHSCQVSSRLNLPNHHIKNVVTWGMSSTNVWPDLTHASIRIVDKWNPAPSVIQNDHWIRNELVTVSVYSEQGIIVTSSSLPCFSIQLCSWLFVYHHLATPPRHFIATAFKKSLLCAI